MQSKARYAVLALFVLACVRTAGAALLGLGNVPYTNSPYVTAEQVHGSLAGFATNTAYHYNATTHLGTFDVDATGAPSLTQGTVSWGEHGVQTFFSSIGRQLGHYHLTLVVNQDGVISSGSLEVRGDRNGIANDGASAGRNDELLFYSTTPTAFGWTGPVGAQPPKMEFQFKQLAGTNETFAKTPGTVNVLLDIANTVGKPAFTGTGTHPFNTADFFVSGQHSTAFYPEPSVMGLLGVGMLLLRRCRR